MSEDPAANDGPGTDAPALEPQPDVNAFPGIKAPDALRTIGEVATVLGIRQHVLRYWEEQFPMLRPVKRSGGRRYYRPEDVALLRTIHRLVDQEGYTLRGARLTIEAGAAAAAVALPVAPAAVAPATSQIADVGQMPDPAPPPEVALAGDALARLRQVRQVLSEALAAS